MRQLSRRPPSRRAPLAVVVLAVVAAVLVSVFAEPGRVVGRPSAAAAADLGASALGRLAELGDLRLRGTLETEGGIGLGIDVVALAGGETTASVTDGAGGAATFVAVDDRVVVNANAAWWLNTVPVYAHQIAGKWVKATEDMGFPIGMLTALSGKRLRDMFAGDDWTAEPTVYVDGTRAMALSPRGSPWTVYLATEGGTRLLGVGGPLAATGDKLRKLGGRAQAANFPYALVSTSGVDDPCRESTGRALADAQQQAATAPAPPPVPEPNHGPSISVTVLPSGTCMTPMCPTAVEVRNAGDETATGMLSVTSTSGGGGVLPISLGPLQSTQQVFQVLNPASSCTQTCTRPYTVTAFAQVTAVAGPDLDTGKRLHERGVDPNRPVPGKPAVAGPDVNSVIDKLSTPGPAVAGFARQGDPLLDEVVGIVQKSGDARLLSLLTVLAKHPAIAVDAGAPSPAIALARAAVKGKGPERLAARQALSLLSQLAQEGGRTPNTLRVDKGLLVDAQAKRVYSIASVTNPEDRDQRVYDAVDKGVQAFAGVDTTGLAKVLVLDFGDAFPAYGQVQRNILVDQLSLHTAGGKRLIDLLRDATGEPAIAELMVANRLTRAHVPGGRYVFGVDDVRALLHQRPTAAPTKKPTSKDLVYTAPNFEHMLQGDPYDPANPGKQDRGGHASGAGGPNKTEFPKAWTPDDIKEAIAQVVDQGNTVDKQLQPTNDPRADRNHMNAQVWSWRYLGQATVKGITVELDLYVYEDGVFRNGYPSDRGAGPNKIATRDQVHVDKTTTLDDRTIFKNPPSPPADPQLNGARTFPPRYNQTADTWEYPAVARDGRPALDQSGNPVVYTTDLAGVPIPGSPVPVAGC
ncbi:EndoU domain-containing protein [Actinokineospora diospyrosa]|nr:EndoU domain-containing protein [Actinokineospora diospyrosa]